ncbi:hypothetical protein MKW94_020415, partial [Papaver nudicaule]|nr:hypothetical protein [Papaver nudicaule]
DTNNIDPTVNDMTMTHESVAIAPTLSYPSGGLHQQHSNSRGRGRGTRGRGQGTRGQGNDMAMTQESVAIAPTLSYPSGVLHQQHSNSRGRGRGTRGRGQGTRARGRGTRASVLNAHHVSNRSSMLTSPGMYMHVAAGTPYINPSYGHYEITETDSFLEQLMVTKLTT